MRRLEIQRSMGPMTIVVCGKDSQDVREMLLVQDQQPVETLRTNRAHKALRHPVRLRRPKRRANDRAASASKYLVETVCKFLVPVANHVAERLWAVSHAPGELSGLLCHPLCSESACSRPRVRAGYA